MAETEFREWRAEQAGALQSVSSGDDGILYFSQREQDGRLHCDIPVFGYYAADAYTLSRLFESLAAGLVQRKPVAFSVSLYAHDDRAIRLFSLLQFGIVSERGIRRCQGLAPEDGGIRELSKTDIANRWEAIWGLTAAIIEHLRHSPVFYPGQEFTEDLYREFYLDAGTRVFGAFAADQTLIGIIESNAQRDELAFRGRRSVNIGEAYVLPQFRGSGLAEKLLFYAETHSAAPYAWVEHGTANPNARGFWGKYFTTYAYTMNREIHGV